MRSSFHKTIQELTKDAAFALFVSMIIGAVLASLSAAGVITMTLASILLVLAWLIGSISPFYMTHILSTENRHRAIWSVVLAGFMLLIWFYEYYNQPNSTDTRQPAAAKEGEKVTRTLNDQINVEKTVIYPADPASVKLLSNSELKVLVTRLSSELATTQTQYDGQSQSIFSQNLTRNATKMEMEQRWKAERLESDALDYRAEHIWKTLYLARTKAAYDELSKRLGIDPYKDVGQTGYTQRESQAKSILTTGVLAGPQPFGVVSKYLEELNQKLH